MDDPLLAALASADPAGDEPDAETAALVRRMTAEAQDAATARTPMVRGWRSRRVMIPLAIAGAVVLTGGAAGAIAMGSLDLWVDHTKVKLDAEIPIVYTTDTGVHVSCAYGVYFGDPTYRVDADRKLAAFVRHHDWSGIGQRIYARALADPFVPGPGDHLEHDSQKLRDQMSFFTATDLIWDEMPAGLRNMTGAGGTSNCTGRLH